LGNPWLDLKKINGEYVAECDRGHVSSLKYDLAFDTLPWPYMGDPENAAVYVLSKSTIHKHALEVGDGEQREKAIRNNLAHSHPGRLPLLQMDPEFNGTGFQEWWRDKLRYVIHETSEEAVARFMFVAQYIPYSHKNKIDKPPELPSQKYTFALVRKAMAAGKTIVLMYPKREWYEAIPQLESYEKCYTLLNPINGIENNNINGNGNFENIIQTIKKA